LLAIDGRVNLKATAPVQPTDLNWPAIQAASQGHAIVFPSAALGTSTVCTCPCHYSLLLGEIIRRRLERLAGAPVRAAALVGQFRHHLDFPGTLSAPPRAYLDRRRPDGKFYPARLSSPRVHQWPRCNDVPGRQAVFEVRQQHRQRHDLLLLFATYGSSARSRGRSSPPATHQMGTPTNGNLDDPAPGAQAGRRAGFTRSGALWPLRSSRPHRLETKDRTVPGHMAIHARPRPRRRALFRVFTDDVVALLEGVLRWDGKSWHDRRNAASTSGFVENGGFLRLLLLAPAIHYYGTADAPHARVRHAPKQCDL